MPSARAAVLGGKIRLTVCLVPAVKSAQEVLHRITGPHLVHNLPRRPDRAFNPIATQVALERPKRTQEPDAYVSCGMGGLACGFSKHRRVSGTHPMAAQLERMASGRMSSANGFRSSPVNSPLCAESSMRCKVCPPVPVRSSTKR